MISDISCFNCSRLWNFPLLTGKTYREREGGDPMMLNFLWVNVLINQSPLYIFILVCSHHSNMISSWISNLYDTPKGSTHTSAIPSSVLFCSIYVDMLYSSYKWRMRMLVGVCSSLINTGLCFLTLLGIQACYLYFPFPLKDAHSWARIVFFCEMLASLAILCRNRR